MSVAAELARIRASGAASSAPPPPSLIHDVSTARRIPRATAAATSLAALHALSAADPLLPTLATPLLLTDPALDRTTLEPEAAAALSAAVVAVARRLSPAFGLRGVQAALEWPVVHVGSGRAAAEVDALLYAGLAFHGSRAFVKMGAAVLWGGGEGKKAWEWLSPMIKQEKPVTAEFVLTEAPDECLVGAIRFSVDSAVEGVLNCPAAVFVAGVVGRRVGGEGGESLGRRRLVLEAAKGLERIREALAEGNEVDVAALVEVGCACLVVMAAGVVGGESDEVVEAVMRSAAGVLAAVGAPGDSDDATQLLALGSASASVLVTCVCVGGEDASMPKKVFDSLAKSGCFCPWLDKVRQQVGTDFVAEALRAYALRAVACVVKRCEPDDVKGEKKHRRALAAMSSFATCAAVTRDVVEDVVFALLEGLVGAEDGGDAGERSLAKECEDFLSPLARGKLSKAVDAAVRRHFGNRSGKEDYLLVDKVLKLALDGTPHAIVKAAVKKSGINSVTRGTLLDCLSHAESAVRLAAIARLSDGEKEEGEKDFGGLGVALLRRIEFDSDLVVVTGVLKLEQLLSTCVDINALVSIVGRRLLAILGETSEDSSDHAIAVCLAVLCLFERIVSDSKTNSQDGEDGKALEKEVATFQKNRVSALFVSLSGKGLLPVEAHGVKDAVSSLFRAIGGICCELLEVVKIDKVIDEEVEAESMAVVADESEKPSKRRSKKAKKAQKKAQKKKEMATVFHDFNGSVESEYLAYALVNLKLSESVADMYFNVHVWNAEVAFRLIDACLANIEQTCVDDDFILRVLGLALDVDGDMCGDAVREASLKCLKVLRGREGSEIVLGSDLAKRVWDHSVGRRDQGLNEELIGVLMARADGSDEAMTFLQDRVYASRDETVFSGNDCAVAALEMICGLCLANRAPLFVGLSTLVAVLYCNDPALRKSALELAHLFAVEFDLKDGCSEVDIARVSWLKSALDSIELQYKKMRKQRRNGSGKLGSKLCLPKWRGRDVATNAIEEVRRSSVQGVLPAPLSPPMEDGVPSSTFTSVGVKLLVAATDQQPIQGMLGMLRACENLSLDADQDAVLIRALVTRDDWSEIESSPAAAECLALAACRLIGEAAKEVSDGEAERLIASLEVTQAAFRSSLVICLLVDLGLAAKLASGAQPNSGPSRHQTLSKTRSVPSLSKVVDILLATSSESSSSEGVLASSVLVTCDGLFGASDCMRVLDALAAEVPAATTSAKRVRLDESVADAATSLAVGVAALEVLSRFDVTTMPLDLSTSAESGLWLLVVKISALAKNSLDSVTDGMEYQMQLALRVLSIVFIFDKQAHSDGLKEVHLRVDAAEMQSAVDAVSYPSWEYSGAVETMYSAIRGAAVNLLSALAGHPGASLRGHILPALDVLARGRLEILESVLPPLVAEGADEKDFVPQITASANGRPATIACAVRACSNRVSALVLALKTLEEKAALHGEDDGLASTVITNCEVSIVEQLHTLASMARPSLVSEHLTRLHLPVNFIAAGGEDEEDKTAAFIAIFDSLVGMSEDKESRAEALGVLLGMMPLRMLSRCVRHAVLTVNENELGHQALEVLTRSLTLSDVLFSSDVSPIVVEICGIVVELLEKEGTPLAIKRDAVAALEQLNRSLGIRSDADGKRELIAAAKTVTDSLALEMKGESLSTYMGAAASCVASFVETMGSAVALLVPRLADCSLRMIEISLVEKVGGADEDEVTSDSADSDGDDDDVGLAVAERGIAACKCILSHLPEFFGRNSLRRIALCVVKVDAPVLQQLLEMAVARVKPDAVISALSAALDSCVSTRGYVVAMSVLTSGVNAMRKKAVKVVQLDLFALCLRGLEQPNVASEASSALLALVLRLPETDFKSLFNKLLEWTEASSESRSASFYTAVCCLFGTLRALMLPYFALVLDSTLKLFDGDAKSEKGNKRKRKDLDPATVLAALNCLTLFIRQLGTSASAELLTKLTQGLLGAFDIAPVNSRVAVDDALAALSGRIVASGPGEESRNLLCALSRGMLLRTRGEDAPKRAAACEAERRMVVAAGDEFLVALPEAMPVLADVVDDEDERVEAAARALVKSLESLSGESIFDQLK